MSVLVLPGVFRVRHSPVALDGARSTGVQYGVNVVPRPVSPPDRDFPASLDLTHQPAMLRRPGDPTFIESDEFDGADHDSLPDSVGRRTAMAATPSEQAAQSRTGDCAGRPRKFANDPAGFRVPDVETHRFIHSERDVLDSTPTSIRGCRPSPMHPGGATQSVSPIRREGLASRRGRKETGLSRLTRFQVRIQWNPPPDCAPAPTWRDVVGGRAAACLTKPASRSVRVYCH